MNSIYRSAYIMPTSSCVPGSASLGVPEVLPEPEPTASNVDPECVEPLLGNGRR